MNEYFKGRHGIFLQLGFHFFEVDSTLDGRYWNMLQVSTLVSLR